MSKSSLLVIQASPRSARSRSRQVAAAYISAWSAARPGSQVIERDLATSPATFVTELWIEGAFGAPDSRSPEAQAALAESDLTVDQVLAASEILIVAPIYNFGSPAVLKAWIDQLVRFGRTFTMNASGYAGLVPSRPVRVISASGGDFSPTGAYWSYNFLEPHLRAVLGFIGLSDVTFVYAPNQSADDATATAALSTAIQKPPNSQPHEHTHLPHHRRHHRHRPGLRTTPREARRAGHRHRP